MKSHLRSVALDPMIFTHSLHIFIGPWTHMRGYEKDRTYLLAYTADIYLGELQTSKQLTAYLLHAP
jgi:hypothetical protein